MSVDLTNPELTSITKYPQSLQNLQRQYHSLHPAYLLSLPGPGILASPLGQAFLLLWLLGQDINDGDLGFPPVQAQSWVKDFAPEALYQIKVWKMIVGAMERGVRSGGEEGHEWSVDDRFYDHITNLMVSSSPPLDGGPKTSYRTFVYDAPIPGPNENVQQSMVEGHAKSFGRITLLEEQIAIQGGTTGLRTWTAALHLGHHVLHHFSTLFPHLPSTKLHFIELGAGTGFVSVLLAQLGFPVVATDLGNVGSEEEEEEGIKMKTPLERLRSNIQLNDYKIKPTSCHLDWYDARKTKDDTLYDPRWEELVRSKATIVAADVIYDPDLVPPLVHGIDALLGDPKNRLCAVISATIRNEATYQLFIDTCRQVGLRIETIELPPMDSLSPTFWDSALDAGTQVVVMRITKHL